MAAVQETVTGSVYPTTTIYRPNKARIEIIRQCRQLSDDTQFSQSKKSGIGGILFQTQSFVIVQFVVAVKDEESGELWAFNAAPKRDHIYINSDRVFWLVAKVEPNAMILSSNNDFEDRQLPPYAGNFRCVLPVEEDEPITYTIKIKLCTGYQVLDMVQFFVRTHERGTNMLEYQSGRTITEVEKPIPKIRMSGVLASTHGRAIVVHFQNLGDNGQYNQFLNDKKKLVERVDGVSYQDLLLAVLLEEATIQYGQNKMEDCLATCREVCTRATNHNSGNWPFLQTKAFYITSAVYRQAKQFDLANENMDKSTQCLEPASLTEETAVNRYNKAALLAEKRATVSGITPEEEREAEQCFKDAVLFLRQWLQREYSYYSMRCLIRTYNRKIMFHLKTSRQRFPDLRVDISEEDIGKAAKAIEDVERDLLDWCPRRLKATFLIGKADLYIRRATRPEATSITEQDRVRDFERAMTVVAEAMEISKDLKMEKEIEGTKDRRKKIRRIQRGLDCVIQRPLQNQLQGVRNEPCERNTDNIEDLLKNMIVSEDEQNRRLENQCSEK